MDVVPFYGGLVEEGNRSDGRSQLKGGQAAGNAT